MTGGSVENCPENVRMLLRDHGDQAIQCCINAWNQLCPDYPLTNTTEVMHRKRWLFFGPDIVDLEQGGDCGQISRIAFGLNGRLTARAFRKHRDLPSVIVNCWIHWNCGETCVRGWSKHIAVDVMKDCVAQFPDVIPATPHVHCCPLP